MMLCYDIICRGYMIGNLANMDRGEVVSTTSRKGKTRREGIWGQLSCVGRWGDGDRFEREGWITTMYRE